MLLLLAGDIEINPGPATAPGLTQGLAKLAATAPEGHVKNIILTWSTYKDVKADLDKQHKVPELRPTLAWLKNCELEDASIKSLKRKSDVLDALSKPRSNSVGKRPESKQGGDESDKSKSDNPGGKILAAQPPETCCQAGVYGG